MSNIQTVLFGEAKAGVGTVLYHKLHELGTASQAKWSYNNGVCKLTFVGTEKDKKDILNLIRNYR